MGKGILDVSLRLLEDSWKLQPGVRIHRIRQTWDTEMRGTAEIIVESPELPDVPEGQKIPWVEARGVMTADGVRFEDARRKLPDPGSDPE